MYEQYGTHFIHASDEWYLLAEEELPKEERYDGYLQLENGVGMLTLLKNEFAQALCEAKKNPAYQKKAKDLSKRRMTLATGKLAYQTISDMAEQMMEAFDNLDLQVVAIRNDFFGERITVSGLLTGQDLIAQLKDLSLGEKLLLPQNILRSGENYFLDDITVPELEETLQVKVDIVKSSGQDFVDSILNI